IVSSFGEKCGVSEYTRNLTEELLNRDVDIKVVANYAKDNLEIDPIYVRRLFHCPFMTNQITADVDGMFDYLKDRELVHVQFETSLYHFSWMPALLKKLKEVGIKIIFTMHSGGIWSDIDLKLIDFFITHEIMWCSVKTTKLNSVIPMGIKFYKYKVPPNYNKMMSFGLGRNNDDFIKEAIKDTNIEYETSYGNQKWLPIEELVSKIQNSWILSLLYPPVGANVSSSAIILAIGCERPILITNTNWFKHVINYPGLYLCDSIEDIKDNIRYLLDPQNRNRISEDLLLRRRLIEADGRSYNSFVDKHIKIYNQIIINDF
ncbi:MAG: hypothetical protein AABY22_35175, partial [Nanoarchaeota archaeon]